MLLGVLNSLGQIVRSAHNIDGILLSLSKENEKNCFSILVVLPPAHGLYGKLD